MRDAYLVEMPAETNQSKVDRAKCGTANHTIPAKFKVLNHPRGYLIMQCTGTLIIPEDGAKIESHGVPLLFGQDVSHANDSKQAAV